MNLKQLFIPLALLFLFSSCTEDMRNKLTSSPHALGTANQIVVIADNELWDGAVGDTFRILYKAAFPMLPRPEPIFDLKHYTPEELEEGQLRKELRTYLFLGNLANKESSTVKSIVQDLGAEKIRTIEESGANNTTVGRNKWAQGQLIFYVLGRNDDDLIKNIEKSFPSISNKVYQHDYEQIKGYAYASGSNKALTQEIADKLMLDIQIPADYVKAMWQEEEKTMWIRKETEAATFNMVFQTLPYEEKAQLTEDNLKSMVNAFGKRYVTTNTPGSYFIINDEDLPLYTNSIKINGNYTLEMRGIWETTEDFMGGPFFAYLMLDEKKNQLVFMLDFLLAPGESKRNLMQQMQLITNTIRPL